MQIERERFEAWLFSQPREREFEYLEGCKTDRTGCLVCNFLREMTGLPSFRTGVYTFRSPEDAPFHNDDWPLPDWLVPLTQCRPLNVGTVQDAYLRLFPDTQIEPKPSVEKVGVL